MPLTVEWWPNLTLRPEPWGSGLGPPADRNPSNVFDDLAATPGIVSLTWRMGPR